MFGKTMLQMTTPRRNLAQISKFFRFVFSGGEKNISLCNFHAITNQNQQQIALAAYEQTGGQKIIHVGGFTP